MGSKNSKPTQQTQIYGSDPQQVQQIQQSQPIQSQSYQKSFADPPSTPPPPYSSETQFMYTPYGQSHQSPSPPQTNWGQVQSQTHLSSTGTQFMHTTPYGQSHQSPLPPQQYSQSAPSPNKRAQWFSSGPKIPTTEIPRKYSKEPLRAQDPFGPFTEAEYTKIIKDQNPSIPQEVIDNQWNLFPKADKLIVKNSDLKKIINDEGQELEFNESEYIQKMVRQGIKESDAKKSWKTLPFSPNQISQEESDNLLQQQQQANIHQTLPGDQELSPVSPKSPNKRAQWFSSGPKIPTTEIPRKYSKDPLREQDPFGPFTEAEYTKIIKDQNPSIPQEVIDNQWNLFPKADKLIVKNSDLKKIYTNTQGEKLEFNESEYIQKMVNQGMKESNAKKSWKTLQLSPNQISQEDSDNLLQHQQQANIHQPIHIPTPPKSYESSPVFTPTKENFIEENKELELSLQQIYEEDNDYILEELKKIIKSNVNFFVSICEQENLCDKAKYVYSLKTKNNEMFDIFYVKNIKEIQNEQIQVNNFEITNIEYINETLNKLLEKQNINSNIYLSDINLLGILYDDEENNIKIVKIIIEECLFNIENRKDNGDIKECKYIDFNTNIKYEFKYSNSDKIMYLLTNKSISFIKGKVTDDLEVLLNQFINPTGKSIQNAGTRKKKKNNKIKYTHKK
jgi:hypothetical protein